MPRANDKEKLIKEIQQSVKLPYRNKFGDDTTWIGFVCGHRVVASTKRKCLIAMERQCLWHALEKQGHDEHVKEEVLRIHSLAGVDWRTLV